MSYQTLVIEGAAQIVEDYHARGIGHIDEIMNQMGRTQFVLDQVKLAGRYLSYDETFADWSFIFTMTLSNELT